MSIPAPLHESLLQGGRFGRTRGRFHRNTHFTDIYGTLADLVADFLRFDRSINLIKEF